MGERKAWSKEEDCALLEIVQDRKIQKWCLVSKAMEQDFRIFGRTGKQCRERWHNQLDPSIKDTEWTREQEQILLKYHDIYGNKWVRISQQLKGRTDNCVKNHFYSILRKAFKRLNKFTFQNKQKSNLKELTPAMLSKLVAVAQQKFDKKLNVSEQLIKKSVEIKHRLIPFSRQQQNTPQNQKDIQILIEQLINFSKAYKKKKGKKTKKEICNVSYQEVIVKQQLLKKQLPIIVEPKKTYTNLFRMSQIQEQEHNKEPNKDITQVSELSFKVRSKLLEDDYVSDIIGRKQSGVSNWSGVFRLPSIHSRVSSLSISNKFQLDTLALESSGHFIHKNLFGVDVLNLQ